jgi:hypothetical protein
MEDIVDMCVVAMGEVDHFIEETFLGTLGRDAMWSAADEEEEE